MPTPLAEWSVNARQMYKQYIEDKAKFSTETFFRDPPRPQYIDYNLFFAPADGVIVYQKVTYGGGIIPIKGQDFTLSDLMGQQYEGEALVISIFMSFFDPHINRIPMCGILHYQQLAAIKTKNMPMLFVEKEIVNREAIHWDDMEYMFFNKRMCNQVFVPMMQYKYYIIQTADSDVSEIALFDVEQNRPVQQNERFGAVRYGSQVDLVLPIDKRFQFQTLCSEEVHVEAGIDALVRIRKGGEDNVKESVNDILQQASGIHWGAYP
jgi:phosphatidylserine decarboxylase